jgi:hypothetical protein
VNVSLHPASDADVAEYLAGAREHYLAQAPLTRAYAGGTSPAATFCTSAVVAEKVTADAI